MRILFLTTQLPYPPISGGVIKSWNLVKHWAMHDLKVVCALKEGEENHIEEFQKLVPNVELYTFPFERKRTPLNLLKSYFKSPSLNVYRNYHPAIRAKVREWIKDVDLVFVDHYEMGQYVLPKDGVPMILHEHNAEYVMWERLAELEKNPLKKALITIESNRIKKAEKLYADRSEVVLAAPNDIKELEKIGVATEKLKPTYHLGDDYLLDEPKLQYDETEKLLLFVGTLTWEANIDGLLWFLESVFPGVLEAHPDVKFNIVGKKPDKRLLEACRKYDSITLTGFVEDLKPCYRKSRVFVIPLRFGSGIKVKLLNAMYMGIPTVTTPIGTEGLNVESGRELFSSTSPDEMVQQVSTLLSSKEKWESIRDLSRTTAEEYTWKKLLENHDRILEEVIKKNKTSVNYSLNTVKNAV